MGSKQTMMSNFLSTLVGTSQRRSIRALAIALSILPVADTASAQIQRSFLNLSFEDPLPPDCTSEIELVNSDLVPGWLTTHSSRLNDCGSQGRTIEMWFQGNPHNVPPHDGRAFAELNAHEESILYQTVCLMQGDEITWKLAHRGRSGDDAMVFQLAAHDADPASWTGTTNIVEATSPNGPGTPNQTCGTIGTCKTPVQENSWSVYEGTFTWNNPTSEQRFGFVAVSGSGGTSVGNFLDSISLTGMTPVVELSGSATSGAEDGAPLALNVLVSGHVPDGQPMEVELSLSHGSTDDEDISWPSPLIVTVPPGNYAATPFPVPITINADEFPEADEDFTVTLHETPEYRIGSTNSCGDPGTPEFTYTILNDDLLAILTLQKVVQNNKLGT